MLQTADGGYVIAGSSSSPNTGQVVGNHGSNDFWIIKLDADGNLTWQKSLGGSLSDQADAIYQTTDGGYVIAGRSNSTDFDVSGVHVNGTNTDFWVVRIDADGDLLWQKALGGTRIDFARSIIQSADGHVVVAGSAQSSDGNLTTARPGGSGVNHDFWVVKLDGSTGNIIWDKALGGTGGDQATSVLQAADGGYVVVGNTDSGNGQVTGFHGGQNDVWVVKLDTAGELSWQRCLGGTGNDQANSIRRTADGGYIVAGHTNSTDFDVDFNNGSSDFWVIKLDSTGEITWENTLGGASGDQARSIKPTTDGGYIVTGYTSSNNTGDLIGQPYNGGINDFWVVKIDSAGQIEWQKVLGGSGLDEAWDVIQDSAGNYLVVGTSNSNDFDVSGNQGNYDYWVVKLGSACTPVTSDLEVSACSSYAWTTGNGLTYTETTEVSHTITSGAANGCDSIVTLHLTIHQPSAFSLNVNHCGPYSLNGQTYNSTGIYTQTLTNANLCDSVITLNLTLQNTTHSTLDIVSCGPYTLNGETYSTTGNYTQVITNVGQCDSTITLNLLIPSINETITINGFTLMSNQPGATYQWINCGNDNTPIPGATSQSYTASVSGTYAVLVSINSCSSVSECFHITVTDIENFSSNSVQVYPNPTAGIITLTTAYALNNATLEIYSSLGHLVHAAVYNGDRIILNLEEYPSGFYFLRLNNQQSYRILKF